MEMHLSILEVEFTAEHTVSLENCFAFRYKADKPFTVYRS
jgi:hypothetical protein